jgi:hypothetical protein
MASGLRVWFAEYEILLSGRERFDEAIRHGVSNCSYGVCFTNDSYSRSEHCCKELRLLLERVGPTKIVEIRCPNQPQTHRDFPALRDAHTLDYSNPTTLLRDLQSVTGLDTGLWSMDAAKADWRDFAYRGSRFFLDFSGWRVRTPWFRWLGGGDRRVLTYGRSRPGTALSGHLIVGPMNVARGSSSVDDHRDDRAYYDRALKFADSFYSSHTRQTPLGVHLSFVPGRASQAGLTTRYRPGVIARLYSVTLSGSRSGDLELAFFFFSEGTIDAFWRSAFLMDRVVHSLRVEADRTALGRLGDLGRTGLSWLGKGNRKRFGRAVLRGDVLEVRELLERGADPNAALPIGGPRGYVGYGTALMAAASEGLANVVKELLAHGARVDDRDSRGWTALLYAVENGYIEICTLLLESGADPNLRTAQSGTALMVSALKGHADIVRLLLDRGADPSARDSTGKSASDLAHKYGRSDVLAILARRQH